MEKRPFLEDLIIMYAQRGHGKDRHFILILLLVVGRTIKPKH